MITYHRSRRMVSAACPTCSAQVTFEIPDAVITAPHMSYPYAYRYVHGEPPHSITVFLDANANMRSYEIGDRVGFSRDIVGAYLAGSGLGPGSDPADVIAAVFKTFATAIIMDVENPEALLRRSGELLGENLARLFPDDLPETALLEQLGEFWKRSRLGYIDDIREGDNGSISFSVHECFECSHLPNLGKPMCKLDEGFLSTLFDKKLGSPRIVREVECYATGADRCRFEITRPAPGES